MPRATRSPPSRRRSARIGRADRGAAGRGRAGAGRSSSRRRPAQTRTQSEFERQQSLAGKEFASQQTLEQARANRDQAVAVRAEREGRDRRRASPMSSVLDAQQQEAARTLAGTADRAGQGRARSVLHRDPRADRRRHRQPRRAGRRLRADRPAARRRWCRSTTSISTPISRRRSSPRLQARPAGRGQRRRAARPRRSTARWRASRRPPARCSRCCRPTTRPATSPRSCSALPCASTCRPTSPTQRLLRPGMSVVVNVNTKPQSQSVANASWFGAAAAEAPANPKAPRRARSNMSSLTATATLPASARSPTGGAGSADQLSPRKLWPSSPCASACSWRSSTSRSSRPRSTEIQAGLSASADEIPWVQTSYLIAEVIAIPLSGFLSRALGTRHAVLGVGGRLHAARASCAAPRPRSTR